MADLVSHPDEIKVVSKRFGQGATNIDRYLELDGYKAVQKALAMESDAIINEIKNSGLRGRGGGEANGRAVGVRRGMAVDRLGHGEDARRHHIEQAAVRIGHRRPDS